MPLRITHPKVCQIADWTQPELDAQIAQGNFPPGTTLADIVLSSDFNADHTIDGAQGQLFAAAPSNVALTDDDDGYTIINTGATGLVNVDFSAMSPLSSVKFIVTDADGINLVSIGTFYLGREVIATDVFSVTVGSALLATKISATEIVLESTNGTWETP